MLHTQYFDKVSASPNYRDLRPLANDKALLRNPHRGFYMHYVDNSFRRGEYRQSLEPGDTLLDFPCLNHLYIRFDWSDIEAREGAFDWSPIDAIMETWCPKGYTVAFRLCVFEGAMREDERLVWQPTPEWVFARGAKCKRFGAALEPDYGDAIFLRFLERFMAEFARKYDGDPRVEFVDVGTFGTWGEGHTFGGSRDTYPLRVLLRHVNLHARYFRRTRLLVNDDMLSHRAEVSPDDMTYLADYCDGKGLGLRDDSILVPYYEQFMGSDSLKSPFLFERVYRHAPVDLERGHYRPEQDKNELVFAAAAASAHATYAGFHGDPRLWLKYQRRLTEYMANRLGYWFFLEGLELPELVSGLPSYASFVFTNRGYAPAYQRFTLRVSLRGEDGASYELASRELDCARWLGDDKFTERVRLDCANVPEGAYALRAGLFEGARPIRLAMDPDCLDEDGLYRLGRAQVGAM